MVLVAIGLVAGSGAVVRAQEDEASANAPALVSGRIAHSGGAEFAEEAETENGFAQRGRTTKGRLIMSDPRLNGDVVVVDDADRFFDGPPSEETYVGDVLWGTAEITNDGGSWTGTMVGTTDSSGGGGNIAYYELTGSGGYEGLSAVIFERESGGWLWDGVIFPGELPPDR
jgi:hypothetical protein